MTALVRWQPYREMVSLSDVMDRMLSRAFVRPFDAFDIAPREAWDTAQASSEDYLFFAQISRSLARFPGARDQLFSHTPLGGIVRAESQPEWRCRHATPKFDRISPG
jgi:hypothetical protein